MKRITMLLGAGILLFCSMLYAAVPQLINFQGILRDGSGNPVANGSYSVQFTIYDAASAGNVLWQETQSVNTSGGLFGVLLGSVSPVPDSVFNDSSRWLGIQVGADPEMTPRQRLVSTPYALRVAHFIPDFWTFNTFIGRNAGNLTMTGTYNTASGVNALENNTTGTFNTATGVQALYFNTAGTGNTASGYQALQSNTTGFNNTASGLRALLSNTTGNNHTACGHQALLNNTTGNDNTAVGINALFGNVTGSNNTALGYQANVFGSNLTNATAIGSGAVVDASNKIRLGNNAVTLVETDGSIKVGADDTVFASHLSSNSPLSLQAPAGTVRMFINDANGHVGIGTSSPAARLDVNGGNVELDPSSATAGNILKGGVRFIHDFGLDNTFIGKNAGNLAMSGSGNTASGANALTANTDGYWNTASGAGALQSNTTGFDNTASGWSALVNNTEGFNNTAGGFVALQSNTTGVNNTACGVYALFSNTTGQANTACGVSALASNTTGSNNTAIGGAADVSAGNLTNATAIGYNAVVNASNKIRLGNAAVTVIEGQVAYTFPSDKNQKENFRPVDGEEVLRKIRGLPLSSWNYKGHDPKQFRHYGPMAQDFFAAFGNDGFGKIGTETTLNSGDVAGILMIAVQALGNENAELKDRIERLEKQVNKLQAEKPQAEVR